LFPSLIYIVDNDIVCLLISIARKLVMENYANPLVQLSI